MSEHADDPHPAQPEPADEAQPPETLASRSRSAIAPAASSTPLLTPLLAFLIGGLVVLVVSGKNPLSTYRAIFNGTGLNWLFPWDDVLLIRATRRAAISSRR